MSPTITVGSVELLVKFEIRAAVAGADPMPSRRNGTGIFRPVNAHVEFRNGELFYLTVSGPLILKDGSDGKRNESNPYRRRKDGRLATFNDLEAPEWVVQLAERVDRMRRSASVVEVSPEGGETR